MEENTNQEVKKRLTPASTVLLTIAAASGAIVLARVIYFIITGA